MMAGYTNVPIAAAGDWIDDAYLNTYLGDNFRAIFSGLTGAGQLLASSSINQLAKVAVTGNNGYVLTEDTSLATKMKFAAAPVSLPAGGSAYQGLRVASGGSAREWGNLPSLVGQQGGSATLWETPGTTNYTPTNSIMQCGAVSIDISGINYTYVDVTFPVPFAYKPFMMACVDGSVGNSSGQGLSARPYSLTASTARIYLIGVNSATNTLTVHWIAIGQP